MRSRDVQEIRARVEANDNRRLDIAGNKGGHTPVVGSRRSSGGDEGDEGGVHR